MLMTMEEAARIRLGIYVSNALNPNESIVAIMDNSRRIMRHEHINALKSRQCSLTSDRSKMMMPFRFVFPSATETAKRYASGSGIL